MNNFFSYFVFVHQKMIRIHVKMTPTFDHIVNHYLISSTYLTSLFLFYLISSYNSLKSQSSHHLHRSKFSAFFCKFNFKF